MTAADQEPSRAGEARRGLRQFVKFCIVGAGSTVIDFGVFTLAYYGVHAVATLLSSHRVPEVPWLPAWLHAVLVPYPALQAFVDHHEGAVLLAATLSFVVAVSNGFYWNRRWTFSHARGASAHR